MSSDLVILVWSSDGHKNIQNEVDLNCLWEFLGRDQAFFGSDHSTGLAEIAKIHISTCDVHSQCQLTKLVLQYSWNITFSEYMLQHLKISLSVRFLL